MTGRFGRGFSTTNLWYFRQFYLAYADRKPEILHKPGGESAQAGKLHKACGELPSAGAVRPKPVRVLSDLSIAIEHPERIERFSPRLSWSHYRVLTKVQTRPERLPAPACGGEDPFRMLDDLMAVVETLCPVWPQCDAFMDGGKMLL